MNTVEVYFADGIRLLPAWQADYITGNESSVTYEEWRKRLNTRLLQTYLRELYPTLPWGI